MLKERPNSVWKLPTGGYVKFGAGVAGDCAYEATRLGAKRVLLISDKGIRSAGITEEIEDVLKSGGLAVEVWEDFQSEPTVELVRDCSRFARDAKPDVVVGLGGGSALDIAKTTRMILVHGGEPLDYIHPPLGKGKQFPGAGAPMIAIPTTSGTGSEATDVSVMAVGEIKTGIAQIPMLPEVALIDPMLTVGMPPRVTASTGVDALAHAVEAFIAKRFDQNPAPNSPEARPGYAANPLSDLLAGEAIRLVSENIRCAVNQGHDLCARSGMSLASYLAGVALESGGCTVPHAVGHIIGGELHIAHGTACGVVLPYYIDYVASVDVERFSTLAGLLDPAGRTYEVSRETAQLSAKLLKDLLTDVDLPTTLAEIGVERGKLESMAKATIETQGWAVPLSPRQVTGESLYAILKNALEGSFFE